MIDNELPAGLKSYAAQARAFREKEAMLQHRKNLSRSAKRATEIHRNFDVDKRWNQSPALLKSRKGRPASAIGLTPQTHMR